MSDPAISSKPATILRFPQVIARTGLRRPTIYLHMKKGTFPRPISLGERAVGWLESDIEKWIQGRIEMSREVSSSVHTP